MEQVIVFADVDGTLFTPGWQLITAPFYNLQTSRILKKYHIPLILVTGRPTWTNTSEWQMKLLGLPLADAIIFDAGTTMYHRLLNGKLEKDTSWEKRVFLNKKPIEEFMISYLRRQNIPFDLKKNDYSAIRITITRFPVSHMGKVKQDILTQFPDNVQVLFTEKLLKENTVDIFSGDLLILSKTAGKDHAIQYLLEKYYPNKFHAFIFGDATIDVPMLSMAMNPKKILLSQCLVHPTSLAKQLMLEEQKKNKNIIISDKEGPEFILETVKEYMRKFSPAQNSRARRMVQPFENILDKIIDSRLTPNEISFLGLEKLKHGVDLVYGKTNFLLKIKGLYLYAFGNLTDVLDGIRARRLVVNQQIPGQLVDVFCDRAKEFYQVFMRVKKEKEVNALMTAITCILPSIARAQAEISGIIVKEQDEKGGSMLQRTKRLFLALFYDVALDNHEKVFQIDKEIYERNVATFENRIRGSKLYGLPEGKNMFQKNALERFILLVQLLQEENEIIHDFLKQDQKNVEHYKKQSLKLLKNYLEIDVKEMRKKYQFNDYNLSLKPFIIEKQLSSNQNSFLRTYISEPSRNILDKVFPQQLSANEITFIGLKKVITSIDTLYFSKKSKLKAIFEYSLGLFGDVADGIRARKTIASKDGQLNDVFADRVREFYQLYIRGKKRLQENPEQGFITLQTAMSCILPTFAKAQAEIMGNVIKETEGTTLWRTKKLFLSLVYDTIFNISDKSFQIDKEILNVAKITYYKRLQKAKKFHLDQIQIEKLSLFEKKALERLLLYIQLLQEEYALIQKMLPKYLKKDYNKWLNSLTMMSYIESSDVEKIRKKFAFPNYNLYLNRFIA